MKDHDDYLALQLYGLECRLQRGEHLQEGGQQLVREYRKLKAAQGKGLRKPKKDHSAVDRAMAEQLAACACGACGGPLKQSRAGSLRAVCQACGERWDFQAAEAATEVAEVVTGECRECLAYFTPANPDSGCGICVGCMGDLQAELLAGESLENYQRTRALARLVGKERFDAWLALKGLPVESVAPEQHAYLAPVLARGRDWVVCAADLPYEDRFGLLTYMVYTPGYGGDLFACHFAAGQWELVSGGVYIGSVTHWRLARPGEQSHRAGPDELPVTRND